MKIIDNVFIVPDVVANPYIIVDADGLTVIDAGFPRNGHESSSNREVLWGSREFQGTDPNHHHG